MWVQITLHNHKPSLDRMIKYCKVDVLELERVHKRINVFIKTKTAKDRDYLCNCPNCGSSHTIVRGYQQLVSGNKNVKLQCQDCRKYHRMSAKKYYTEKAKMTS